MLPRFGTINITLPRPIWEPELDMVTIDAEFVQDDHALLP